MGYGSVSEAMAHICPLLYIPRVHWPEQAYLEALLADGGGTAPAGARMSEQAFIEGRWSEPLLTQAAVLRQGMQAWLDQQGNQCKCTDTDIHNDGNCHENDHGNDRDPHPLRSSRVVLGEGVLLDGSSADVNDAPGSSVSIVTKMVVAEYTLALGGCA